MIRLAAWISAIILVAGALGRFAAPFDSLALLRVPAAFLLLATAWRLPRVQRWTGLALAAAALASWSLLRMETPVAEADLLLYQKNSFFRNATPDALAADIVSSGADVVTLQELSRQNSALYEYLEEEYPLRHACRYQRWSVAVMARLPAGPAAPVCSEQGRFAALQVMTDKGAVWIVSLHLYWPWPHPGWDHGRALAAEVAALDGPVIVAGDFNTVAWSATVRRLARAAGSAVIGPSRASLRVDLWGVLSNRAGWTGLQAHAAGPRYIPMPIDHVLAPAGQVEHRPLLGSDHEGLLARIRLDG